MKFKLGDKVLADDCVGIIVGEYHQSGSFDWEVAFINKAPSNCWLDCYKETFLKHYDWSKYPKTFMEKFRHLLTKEELK